MFYQSVCLLSLCSRSCLHSALIDEVVATFTLTLIEVRGKKTIKPVYLRFFLHIHYLFFPSLLEYVLSVSLSLPYFFSLSVKFNELTVLFYVSPHCSFLSTLCCSSCYRSSLLLRSVWSLPPIDSCQISGLSVHNTVLTVHTLYISLVLSLALSLSLIF